MTGAQATEPLTTRTTGFVTRAYAQARLLVATVTNALYLVPLLAIGIGWPSLEEAVHRVALAGGATPLAGLRWPARPALDRRHPQHPHLALSPRQRRRKAAHRDEP